MNGVAGVPLGRTIIIGGAGGSVQSSPAQELIMGSGRGANISLQVTWHMGVLDDRGSILADWTEQPTTKVSRPPSPGP